MRPGFTLVELIIVVIIIGILATFAMPQYAKSKERSLDNEAKVNLVMIQAAENLYKIEVSSFYAATGGTAHADLNSHLNISLPPAGEKWNYTVKDIPAVPAVPPAVGTPAGVCAQATRNGYDNRNWKMTNTDNAPSTGACP